MEPRLSDPRRTRDTTWMLTLLVTWALVFGVGFLTGVFVGRESVDNPVQVAQMPAAGPQTEAQPAASEPQPAETPAPSLSPSAAAAPANLAPTVVATPASKGPVWAARHMFIAINGQDVSDSTRKLLETLQPGGVVLRDANLRTSSQTLALSRAIKQSVGFGTHPSSLPIIAVSQEGGAGNALRLAEAPTANQIASTRDAAYAHQLGSAYAAACLARGISLVFGPVLDVYDPASAFPAFVERSFSSDQSRVSALGLAMKDGLQEGGVLPIVKYFPGYGAATYSSDGLALVIDKDLRELARVLLPFNEAIRKKVPGVLVGHVALPALDRDAPSRPASLSPVILQQLLRQQWAFEGVILIDDLVEASTNLGRPPEELAVEAMIAGADAVMLLDPNPARIEAVAAAIEDAVNDGRISQPGLQRSVERLDEWQRLLTVPNAAPPMTVAAAPKPESPSPPVNIDWSILEGMAAADSSTEPIEGAQPTPLAEAPTAEVAPDTEVQTEADSAAPPLPSDPAPAAEAVDAQARAEEEALAAEAEKQRVLAAEQAAATLKAEEDARFVAEEKAAALAKQEARAAEEEALRVAEQDAAKLQAEQEAATRAAEEEAARAKAEDEARIAAETNARAEEESRLKAEAEAAAMKAADEARVKAEAESMAAAEAEARKTAEEESERLAKETAERQAADEAKAKAEAEAERIKASEDAKRAAAEERARIKAEEAEAEAAEAEAKRAKAEEQARLKAEAQREEEARILAKAEEDARQRAEEQARLAAAEEEARKQAEAEAQRAKAEEEVRALAAAEQEARNQAEAEALRAKAEEEVRALAAAEQEARNQAEELRAKAEEEARALAAVPEIAPSIEMPPAEAPIVAIEPLEAAPAQATDSSAPAANFPTEGSVEISHTVAPGETLMKIAAFYEVPARDIRQWNGLDNDLIKYGTTLKLFVAPDRARNVTPPQGGIEDAREMVHVVEEGDTLTSIAKQYEVELRDLVRWNALSDARLTSGQELRVVVSAAPAAPAAVAEPEAPAAPEYVLYTVKRGDTLSSIARRHGATNETLMQMNNITDANQVMLGQRLKVPKTQ